MSDTARLIMKGHREPREGLVQQGYVHVGLAKKLESELEAAGWTAEKTKELEQGVMTLESNVSIQADGRSVARDLTSSEQVARADAKAFVEQLRNVLPIALRATPVAGVDAAAFKAGEALGQSTPKVRAYLTRIRLSVVKLDAGLLPYFGGKKASERLDEVNEALKAADTTQEVTLSGLPQDTLAVYETKGKVLEMIEDMNRIAKNAFKGQAARVAEFNKDVLKRSRTERKKKDPKAAKEAPKEAAKEAAKEAPKEAAKEAPKETAKEATKEATKAAMKEAPKEAKQEVSKEAAKEAPKEAKEAPQEVKEAAKEVPTEVKKAVVPQAAAAPQESAQAG